MKRKLSILSSTIFLCTGLACGAAAQAHGYDGHLTRADVQFELSQARASGEQAMVNSEDTSASIAQYEGTSSLTRHQVRDELEIARMNGTYALTNSDDSIAFTRAHQGESMKTRSEVRAELMRAEKDGELRMLNSEDSMQRMRIANEISAE